MTEERILGSECQDCQTKTYPARIFCPNCRSQNNKPWEVPTQGEVYTYTKVAYPLAGYDNTPYNVGIIKVTDEDMPRVTARIDIPEGQEVKTGQKVTLTVNTFEESGELPILVAKLVV